MVQSDVKNTQAIQRLTALWALSESGLGGIMHALKIPFTGFFIGGFAVVIISLLAFYSKNNTRQMLQATLLVLLVKAAVSPHSPWPAYIAVGFQGLAGAIIYRFIPFFSVASPLFGFIALLESALQKFILTTLIFGKSIWEALDLFFQGLLKDFSLPTDFSFSFWLIAVYTGVYAVWGIIIGLWITRLPKQVENRSQVILSQFSALDRDDSSELISSKSKKMKLVSTFFILIFIGSVFLMSGADKGLSKALYVIMRTVAVLLFFFWIITPLIKWILSRWKSKNQVAMQELINQLPELRNQVRPAYKLASTTHTGIKKYREFVFILLVVTLHSTKESSI
jgi:hypothetical protein